MFSLVLCTLDSLWGDSWAFNETIQGLAGPKAHCWWFQINDCLTGSPAVWRHVPVSWGEPPNMLQPSYLKACAWEMKERNYSVALLKSCRWGKRKWNDNIINYACQHFCFLLILGKCEIGEINLHETDEGSCNPTNIRYNLQTISKFEHKLKQWDER